MNNISDFAHVDPNVIMGDNNIICEGAIVRGGVILGSNNFIGPYCIIGEPAEKKGVNTNSGVRIGDNNRFTKQVTIDSGYDRQTTVGNNVWMLKNAHIGHGAVIHDNVVLSCNSVIGGETEVGAGANFGLGSIAHQRLTIPEDVMIGMGGIITKKSELNPSRKYVGNPVKDVGENGRNF